MSNQSNLIIDAVITRMSTSLSPDQLTLLEATLIINLKGFKIEKECTEVAPTTRGWDYFLPRFRANKKLKNCSEKTIRLYDFALNKLREYVDLAPQEIQTSDIKYFLAMYGEKTNPVTGRKPSKTYLNNFKNQLSSFFSWMQEEGYISRNPVDGVPKIKTPKTIKHAYNGKEMEALKDNAKSDRDMALIHFLDSTGVRVSEAISIDRDQIEWTNRTIIFYGTKGKAERQVIFSEECAYWLKKYLDSRTDNNPALFVGKIKPYNRLTVSGAEFAIKELGKAAGIHAHPHRFRRTMITRNVRRGMSLHEIQTLVGHTNAQTTQVYIDMQQQAVKASYEKYN